MDVPREELAAGVPAFRLFERAGLAKSGGEARRLIRGGGARVNDAPVTDEGQVMSLADLRGGAIKLSAGTQAAPAGAGGVVTRLDLVAGDAGVPDSHTGSTRNPSGFDSTQLGAIFERERRVEDFSGPPSRWPGQARWRD